MKILLLFAQSASVLGKQRNSSYNVSAMHFMIDDDDGLLLDSVPYKLALYVLKNDLFENQVRVSQFILIRTSSSSSNQVS